MSDGTIIRDAKIIVRPSGTEPKIKLYASVAANALGETATDEALDRQIESVNKAFRMLLDDVLLRAYDASEAEYGGVKVPQGPNKRLQMIRIYFNMPVRQKLGFYFPLVDRIKVLSQEILEGSNALPQARKEVETKLKELHKSRGIQYIADAFKINLRSQREEDISFVKLQAQILFGESEGDEIFLQIQSMPIETSSSIEDVLGARIFHQQALNILSWIKRGVPGADKIKLTRKESQMLKYPADSDGKRKYPLGSYFKTITLPVKATDKEFTP